MSDKQTVPSEGKAQTPYLVGMPTETQELEFGVLDPGVEIRPTMVTVPIKGIVTEVWTGRGEELTRREFIQHSGDYSAHSQTKVQVALEITDELKWSDGRIKLIGPIRKVMSSRRTMKF